MRQTPKVRSACLLGLALSFLVGCDTTEAEDEGQGKDAGGGAVPGGGQPGGAEPGGGQPGGAQPGGGQPGGAQPGGAQPGGAQPGGGLVECGLEDCGAGPPVACLDGSSPYRCELQADGACAFTILTCPEDRPVCEQPIVVGPCEAAIPAWAYDAGLGRCVEFTYGGCQGNDNRFETREACEATCAGQPGLPCGGRAGNTCDTRDYCEYGERSSCGFDDAQGVCTPRPEVCPQVVAPVCGCDGLTHGNACEAAAAGADVLHPGECEGTAACADASRDPLLVQGGRSFGECLENCRSNLTLDASVDPASPCDAVQVTVCGNVAGAPCVEQRGRLTPAGHDRARDVAAALVGVALEARYGCPDCADGGAATVELVREGTTTAHEYPFGAPPLELVDADAFAQGLIDALRACASTPEVDVLPGCVAVGR